MINRRSIGSQSERSSDKHIVIGDNGITESITKNITISDSQKIILAQMKKNPKTSASDLAKTLGIADRNVKNHIKNLKEAGFLERVGSPKGGYWVVSEKSIF